VVIVPFSHPAASIKRPAAAVAMPEIKLVDAKNFRREVENEKSSTAYLRTL
jgi:hypothetical protein